MNRIPLFLIVIYLAFSCNNNTRENELTLKERELNIKERELKLERDSLLLFKKDSSIVKERNQIVNIQIEKPNKDKILGTWCLEFEKINFNEMNKESVNYFSQLKNELSSFCFNFKPNKTMQIIAQNRFGKKAIT